MASNLWLHQNSSDALIFFLLLLLIVFLITSTNCFGSLGAKHNISAINIVVTFHHKLNLIKALKILNK